VLAFQTGAGDFHTDVRVDYIPELLDQVRRGERDDFHAFGTFGTYFWSFNCTPTLADGRANPFYDPAVRRAFAMATDKREIIDRVRRSGETLSDVLIPRESIAGFTSPTGIGFDPVRARDALAAAGWIDRNSDGIVENERGEPFPVVEMLYTTAGYHKNIALAMGRMWEKTLGVRTKLVAKETKVYKDDLDARNFMVARGGWFGDYGDPTTFLNLHRTGDGNNDRGYSDPHFDDLMRRSDIETDPQARMRLLEEAERYTMEETLPVLPLFQYDWYYMFEPPTRDGKPNPGGLANISLHPRLVQYYWKLEVVE
jgi:oligopeptide transport system substrate-binding protein